VRAVRRAVARRVREGTELSHPTHSAFAIAHTRTRRDVLPLLTVYSYTLREIDTFFFISQACRLVKKHLEACVALAKPEDRDGDGAAESQRLAEASLGRTLLPGLSLLFSNAAASNEAWQAMVRVARFPNPPHTVLPLTLVTFFPYIAQHVIDPFRVTIAGAAPRDVAVPAVRRVARVLRRRRRRRMRFHFRGGWGRFRGCRGRRTRRPW
jgi:hypothetical protein